MAESQLDTVFAKSRFTLLQHWDSIAIVCPKPKATVFQNTEKLKVFPCVKAGYVGYLNYINRVAKRIVEDEKIDVIIAQDPFLGFAVHPSSRRLHTPLIVELHADYLDNPHWLRETYYNRALNPLGKYIVKHAASVRPVSEILKNYCLQKLTIPFDRVLYTPSVAVQTSIFHPRNLPREGMVLCVSRLVKQKALPLALHAFSIAQRSVKDSRLKIVGRGPEEANIKRLMHELHLEERVELITETLSHEELAGLYNRADVFLNTSYYEGGPRTVFEAMACGTPSVSTPVGRVPELIVNDVNGYVVPWQPYAIAQRIMQLITDSELRSRLGRKAAETVKTQCAWDDVFRSYALSIKNFVDK